MSHVLSTVQGGVVAGLGCAGVMFGAVGAASDLMQDFRTGYLTLASAKVYLILYPGASCTLVSYIHVACHSIPCSISHMVQCSISW